MDSVLIFEMAPRDGLQNEKREIPTSDKIALVNALSDCGLQKIETTSFVSPRWVPQMADAAEVLSGITRKSGVRYTALTPNLKGFERAVEARADEIAIFGAASETFSQKNINASISDSLERFRAVADAARQAAIPVRGYVSCVTDCPYEGKVDPAMVARVTSELLSMGCYEVSLGDTIGHGTPESIANMLSAVLEICSADQLAGHYHDTEGTALANIRVSIAKGLRTFDAAAGGLGGCPYAPGAKGNVATENVVDMLEAEGLQTGIDIAALSKAAKFAQTLLHQPG